MRLIFLLTGLLLCALPARSNAGTFQRVEGTLSGFVRDSANGESIPFASVYIKGLKIGTATNAEGYFAIPNVPDGEHEVQVSIVGYLPSLFVIAVENGADIVHNISLVAQSVDIPQVVVTADLEEERRATQTSHVILQAADVTTMPTVGEPDIFRALQLMPGVKATSEISSGLNVRGGSTDQNLILLDGTVVYNPSHFFGFFSTFNTDAVKDIDLMKGGFPAEYGGRLSSVLNVTNIDGDRMKSRGKASISLLSTRLTGEGPVGDGSWFLSARRTYFDQFISLAHLDTGKDALPLYYFYDANFKLNQNFGQNDKLSIVGYLGQDNLDWKIGKNELAIDMSWGNRTGALKWTHVFSPTVFSNIMATYSRYTAAIGVGFSGSHFEQDNGVDDYSLRTDVDFFVTNDHFMKLGAWWSAYRVSYQQFSDGDPYVFLNRPSQIALYAEDEWQYDLRWKIQYGFRFEYQNLSRSSTIGPRLNLHYAISDNTSLKFATGFYHQYLTAVPAGTDNGFSPFDIWVPINDKMKTSRAYDLVMGYETKNIADMVVTLEAYYKKFNNILYFRNEITDSRDVSDLFYTGSGDAYGVELFLNKSVGRLTGMIGYTLAWTNRRFPELNRGASFMPKYDRRHDLSVTASYALSPDWKIGSAFTYQTGQPYTTGVARYQVDANGAMFSQTLPGPLFNRRLSAYNRLDFMISKRMSIFGLQGSWYIQVYNIYSRRNVWFKQFDDAKNPAEVSDVKLLPIIPTVGMEVSF